MRKLSYLTVAMVAAACLVLMGGGQAQAITSHVCVNCHTMHNSQNDSPMAKLMHGGAADATPNGSLVKYSGCAGCHSSNDSTQTIVDDAPIVYTTDAFPAAAKVLAGGNFYGADGLFSEAAGSHTAHYCTDLPGVTPVPIAPPGFATVSPPSDLAAPPATWGPQGDTWDKVGTLTCAGVYGCHGDRSKGASGDEGASFAAVSGLHHGVGDITGTNRACDGTTPETSYRFLNGIAGVECNVTAPYEQNVQSNAHNVYYGVPAATTDDTSTISALCAECHGDFYSAANTGTGGLASSPWIRHPTDIAFTDAIGDDFTTLAYTTVAGAANHTYDPLVPVGWNDHVTDNTTTAVVATTNIIVCLSCHRAHGSPYANLIRWPYNGVDDQTAVHSCRTCHASK